MESLEGLRATYESAAEVDDGILTAEQLAYKDRTVYKMGSLVITAVYLRDVGLKGGNGKIQPEEGYVNDESVEDLAAMAALGLPSCFGGKHAKAGFPKKRTKKGAAGTSADGDDRDTSKASKAAGMAAYHADELADEGCDSLPLDLDPTTMTWQQLEMLGLTHQLAHLSTTSKPPSVHGRAKGKGRTGQEGVGDACAAQTSVSPPAMPPPPPPPPPAPPPPAPPPPPPFPPLPALHPELASLPAAAMQWQEVYDHQQGRPMFFNVSTHMAQPFPPADGYVPLRLKEDADNARRAAHASAVAASQHALHMPPSQPQPQRVVRGAVDLSSLESNMLQQPPHPQSEQHGYEYQGPDCLPQPHMPHHHPYHPPPSHRFPYSQMPHEHHHHHPEHHPHQHHPHPHPNHFEHQHYHPHPHYPHMGAPHGGWPPPGMTPPVGYAQPQPQPHHLPPPPGFGCGPPPPPGFGGPPAPHRQPPPGFGPPQPPPGFHGPHGPPLPPGFGGHAPSHAPPHAHGAHGHPMAPPPPQVMNHQEGPGLHACAHAASRALHTQGGGDEVQGCVQGGLQPGRATGEDGGVHAAPVPAAAAAGGAGVRADKKQGGGSHHRHEGTHTSVSATVGGTDAGGEEEEEAGKVERVVLDTHTAAYLRSLLPRNVSKYWLQRYSLFAKFDDGIQLDTEGWWSVTPEVLAAHQSAQCRAYSRGHIALDAMAGCGGNAIQLTRDFNVVYAVEISAKRAAMAAHNAQLYGVDSKVEVLCTDFFKAAPTLVADAIFVSPPWGGPKYKWCDTFEVLHPVEGMSFSIRQLLDTALGVVGRTSAGATPAAVQAGLCAGVRSLFSAAGASLVKPVAPPAPRFVSGTFDLSAIEGGAGGADSVGGGTAVGGGKGGRSTMGVVALFLPRNTHLRQLASLVPKGSVWQVERNYVNGKLKGITWYCFRDCS